MNPFFFGDSAQALYGVYHPPMTHPAKTEGVLLCPPFGQEYMRSHRAYRQLAMLLSKKGYPVLRFDYRGTGDSSMDIEDISIDDWIADIVTAANELKETAQVASIHIVGLRLGSLLASRAIDEGLEVKKLALWDAVISGQHYDSELQFEMTKEGASKCNLIDAQETLHFNGFPLSQKKRNALKQIDLTQLSPKAEHSLLIVAKEAEEHIQLKQAWGQHTGFVYNYTPCPGDWNYVDTYGGILLPQAMIQGIVNWIATDKVAP